VEISLGNTEALVEELSFDYTSILFWIKRLLYSNTIPPINALLVSTTHR